MIALDNRHLMMIEPKSPATEPICDETTRCAERVFASAHRDNVFYKGVHACICGRQSDNCRWLLSGGVETNSLMVHYVECHRSEIPQCEFDKLAEFDLFLRKGA